MSDTKPPARPPEELEPGELIEAELGRLVRHPRAEGARLKQVAADGEQGSTPFIEGALVVADGDRRRGRRAVLGDNIGYLLGRRGLRPLLAGVAPRPQGAFPRAIARRRHDRE